MPVELTTDYWWKSAVFYCLDVETFQDGDGDGIGDFEGLTSRLPYLAGLGVTCLWLMPFYPSPGGDDGYDITDYYSVDPRLGSLGDFVELVRAAHAHGLRVIVDLVINHTSDKHPWFQAARADRNSRFRDWYVWSDSAADGPEQLVFPDAEDSNWEWDEAAGQYFLHRFYRHQPDLNIVHAPVREEIARIIGFWLQLGLDGFRVDAVPYLIEAVGSLTPHDYEPHNWLRELRSFIGRREGEAVLMGEVNLSFEETRRYFGNESGDELHMCLNFNLNQALALAIARGDSSPIVRSLRSLPSLPAPSAWGNFVRNHDEWSLDKLSAAEREEVFRAFGPKPDMQLFGRGLRRRLPPALGGDDARVAMTYGLLYALPGAPVLFYGEEIGMAENLEIPGRLSVRAPMQWSDDANGGFSSAPEDQLVRPMVTRGKFSYRHVNVERADRDPSSLLNWIRTLIRARRETPEIGHGTLTVLDQADAAVLILSYELGSQRTVTLSNLAPAEREVEIELPSARSRPREIVGQGRLVRSGSKLTVSLAGYGTRWLRMS